MKVAVLLVLLAIVILPEVQSAFNASELVIVVYIDHME